VLGFTNSAPLSLLKRCVSAFYLFELCIVLTVYVDDIVISGDDSHDITVLKEYLIIHFHMKDLGNLCYLG